jgi:DNA-binding transcriptional ArsR family regulator
MSVFEVISEPSRREILDLLSSREQPVGELVARLELTQPAVSKHLRVLRDAGLVRVRRDGQRRIYRLCPERLEPVDVWLAPYRRMWGKRLDDLERHMETMDDDAGSSDVRNG